VSSCEDRTFVVAKVEDHINMLRHDRSIPQGGAVLAARGSEGLSAVDPTVRSHVVKAADP
jgi:hypothetical protein